MEAKHQDTWVKVGARVVYSGDVGVIMDIRGDGVWAKRVRARADELWDWLPYGRFYPATQRAQHIKRPAWVKVGARVCFVRDEDVGIIMDIRGDVIAVELFRASASEWPHMLAADRLNWLPYGRFYPAPQREEMEHTKRRWRWWL